MSLPLPSGYMADEGSSSSSNPTSPPLGWEDGHVVPEELKVLSEPLKVKTGSAHSFSTSFDNLRSPWLRRVSMSALSLVQIGRDARSISFHGSPHRDGLVPRRSVSEAALHALEGRVSAAKYKAHEYFLERFLTRHERAAGTSLFHPLARWRSYWRWLGVLLLLAHGALFTSASWAHYRCEQSEQHHAEKNHLCGGMTGISAASQEWSPPINRAVQAYSVVEVVIHIPGIAPRGAVEGLTSYNAAVFLLDLTNALPWAELAPLLLHLYSNMPTFERLSSDFRARTAPPPPPPPEKFSLSKWWDQTNWGRTVTGYRRLVALPPLPWPLDVMGGQRAIDFLVDYLIGTKTSERISALPVVGDVLLEGEIFQAPDAPRRPRVPCSRPTRQRSSALFRRSFFHPRVLAKMKSARVSQCAEWMEPLHAHLLSRWADTAHYQADILIAPSDMMNEC